MKRDAIEVTVEMMARCREERRDYQLKIIDDFKVPCLSFALNIPGAVKDSPLYRRIHAEGVLLIEKAFHGEILYAITRMKPTGPESAYAVKKEAALIKAITAGLEGEHRLGRIFDMDVIGTDGLSISRRDLGLPSRKCLICSEEAALCARSRKHSLDTLLAEIESIARDV